jgi:hypothetical protein
VAGAQFGYTLLWVMIPTTVALVVVQEMAARMGAVTGKGLSDLIREEFGFRVTFWLMLALVVTNFGNVMAEFAGVASSLELFGISRYIVVPLAAAAVWALVVQGTYDSVEKIFLVASGFYICYIVAGVLAHPDWRAATFAMVTRPEGEGLIQNYGYLYMLIGLVGTTIAPWMQFYLQASVVEKGVNRATVPRLALGRDCRMPVRGDRRVVHHRGVCGDAAFSWRHPDPGCRRCGPGAQAARRRVRVPAVCGRPLQRLAVCGVYPADLHLLCGLRRPRLRIGARQEVPRSARLLLALHGAHRRGRGCTARALTSRSPASWCSRRW